MPLTVVVGGCGTEFRPPAKAFNVDMCIDACVDSCVDSCIDVACAGAETNTNTNTNTSVEANVCFTVHQFFVTPVEQLVLDRCSRNLTTTIFVWATELVLLKNVLPLANVVYQDDMCSRTQCLALATTERWTSAWLPLCDRCSAKADGKKA